MCRRRVRGAEKTGHERFGFPSRTQSHSHYRSNEEEFALTSTEDSHPHRKYLLEPQGDAATEALLMAGCRM